MSADQSPDVFTVLSGGPGQKARIPWFVLATAMLVLGLTLEALDYRSTAIACLVSVYFIFSAGFLTFAGSRHGRGVMLLDQSYLQFRSTDEKEFRPWPHRYEWGDIDSAEAMKFEDSGFLAKLHAPLLGAKSQEKVVVLDLKVPLVWPLRPPFGTTAIGISSLFVNQVIYYVEDPERLAIAIQGHLGDRASV